ncbi:prolyl oligopeptidase family serine peptidase [Amycolatopsis nigrescens]|uniref:prolyl oligopeptidase family serine peptidase n=1 Tax=Amycolatopsis nigrescens TaxID=381445 RepID=UPI0003801208|nr:prolyl oligopeptidase family serine peptidase [Amycolatopsis nigrescens]
MQTSSTIKGVAAGVPFVALAPTGGGTSGALVVTWHLMDAPRTEAAMAAALPMHGLDAWRVYLGLPMFGGRSPAGGPDEVFRLAAEDYVLNVAGPVAEQAADELPAAVAALRTRLSLVDGPVGVAGGSAGAAVALEVLARAELPIEAAALVSPVTQLAPVVAANERAYDTVYDWTERSRAVADRFDFVRRAGELDAEVLLVTGEADDIAIREPAAALARELGARARLVTVPDMAHALAEEPGVEPAPQTAHAAVVDAEFTAWFRRHLSR